MKPHGMKPGDYDVGQMRPKSGSVEHIPGGHYEMSQTEVKRVRRRLKKKARQEDKLEIKNEENEISEKEENKD